MTKKEEKPKETIAEPIFEEIPLMAALPEALAPERAAEVAEELVVALAPARPHYNGLRGEISDAPCLARNLFWYLFSYTFRCGAVVQFRLRHPLSVWEVTEDAEYDVTVYNRTFFDLTGVRVDLRKSADDGKATILAPPGASISLGDINHGRSETGTFRLHGDEAGDITLRVRVSGYIDGFKRSVYKPWEDRTYHIY
jgi:hypothetical protein